MLRRAGHFEYFSSSERCIGKGGRFKMSLESLHTFSIHLSEEEKYSK
jgi:hypothetical protein